MTDFAKHAQNRTLGLTLHSARWYDLSVWLFLFGHERAFRAKMLEPACLQPGESVLDVGCGTGSLAILAKRQLGTAGEVLGIDASPEMIERARWKAGRAHANVKFDVASAQSLPFEDASFDVVLSTLLFHHLPRPSRAELACEIKRVLKPGGRALVVDFAKGRKRKGILGSIHTSHGSSQPAEIEAALSSAGLIVAASAPLRTKSLHYVLAQLPGADGQLKPLPAASSQEKAGTGLRTVHPLVVIAGLLLLLALHLGGAAAIAGGALQMPKSVLIVAATILGVVLLKAATFAWLNAKRRSG